VKVARTTVAKQAVDDGGPVVGTICQARSDLAVAAEAEAGRGGKCLRYSGVEAETLYIETGVEDWAGGPLDIGEIDWTVETDGSSPD